MGKTAELQEGISVPQAFVQCLLMCAVFYLWSSPAIQPVKIMVVLFHEMSHGFAAIATGGKVLTIAVTVEEGGVCETEGGIPELIVSAGYLGSMFFGGLLLYLSRFRGSIPIVYTCLTLTMATAIFTVLHDPFSRSFATALAASFIFLGLISPAFLGMLVLRLMGTISCLYSIIDIYWDVLASRPLGLTVENDAVAFAKLTGVSAEVVGAIWLAVSIVYFLLVMRIILRQAASPEPGEAKAASAKA